MNGGCIPLALIAFASTPDGRPPLCSGATRSVRRPNFSWTAS